MLAQNGAVELHDDGSACVTTGTGAYEVAAAGTCACPDAQHRDLTCKHVLAVLIHTRAQALLAPSTAPEPAPIEPPAPKRQAKARPSAAWDEHEAPASACFKFRVGSMELLYTLRGIDDTELQRRMAATLPSLHELMAACEARTPQCPRQRLQRRTSTR